MLRTPFIRSVLYWNAINDTKHMYSKLQMLVLTMFLSQCILEGILLCHHLLVTENATWVKKSDLLGFSCLYLYV
jgi:hypothetical protein